MGRKLEVRKRIGLPRQYLHVMNRGARKISIFSGDKDRSLFVSLLGKFALRYRVSIVAWCLVPNHYHLATDSEGTPLSKMMHDLDGTYAKLYNQRHGTTGCLFQGPFKSMSIVDLDGLAYVSRYIHRNSLDVGVDPGLYVWSSCRSYLGAADTPAWLDPSPVLQHIGGMQKSSCRAYREYLNGAPPKNNRRRRRQAGSMEELQYEYVRFLEERMMSFPHEQDGSLGQIQLRTVVCWVAMRQNRIPARVLSDYFGFGNEASVRVIVSRFQERLSKDLDLLHSVEVLTNTRRVNVNRPNSIAPSSARLVNFSDR